MVDLSIIIVSWNVADLLAACLDSIVAAPVTLLPPGEDVVTGQGDRLTAEVIVVESASHDHTPEVLARYPVVHVLPQPENVGFPQGNNIGLAAARGRHLLLLNPDTEIIGDALRVMVDYLDAHPDVGLVGPHTLNSDGTTQSSRRNFPTFITALFESTWLQPLAPRRVLDHYYIRSAPDDGIFDVGWVQGSAMLARREMYEQVGGMDAGYFMYSEEMDWCRRAQDAGWRVVYVGTAQIMHHGGKSTEQVAAQSAIYFQRSKVRYFRIHHSAFQAEALRWYLLAQYAWQYGVEWIKARLGHKPALRQERMRAYRQVLQSRLLPEE